MHILCLAIGNRDRSFEKDKIRLAMFTSLWLVDHLKLREFLEEITKLGAVAMFSSIAR
jgi:hypothetical protein